MLAKRFGAAAAGFIGGGLLSMILLALMVSIFELAFQSVMPAALIVGSICGVVGFCFPGIGASLFAMVDW
jgi:hypothetical protein